MSGRRCNMARVWTEGFEHGIPNEYYQPGGFDYQWEADTLVTTGTGATAYLTEGRVSGFAMKFTTTRSYTKFIALSSEVYLRDYVYITGAGNSEWLSFGPASLIRNSSFANKAYLYVTIAGSSTLIGSYDCQEGEWKKIELYIKTDETNGAYELKIDNISVVSATGVNTGSTGVTSAKISGMGSSVVLHDDIAINDTTGDINNSWCGDGHIVGLLPKADGAETDWTAEGYAVAEAGSNSTTLNITGHGLVTNDVIYNETRNTYSIVTRDDDNKLTTASIGSQTAGDIIVLFTVEATIEAGTGTTTSLTVLLGHNLEAYDVTVNTTRSNAIRRVLYVAGSSVYNSETSFNGTLYDGQTVTSQAAGDSIKTFKVKHYTLTNWKTCANERPNPQYSRIKSNTSDHKSMFDMQELVADKGIASTSQIKAVSLSLYAGDIGTGGSEIIPILKSGVVEEEETAIALPAITRLHNLNYDKSPFTSVAWTRAEVDGLIAGVKVV